tara:strand:- start:854 stop:1219 length:366 start_codon:yes stop_codon:yes gene_type:complete
MEFWLPGSNEPVEVTGSMDIHERKSDFNFSSPGYGFAVNATNSTVTTLDFTGAPISSEGVWALYYQKRVIDSSMWTSELVNEGVAEVRVGDSGLLPAPTMLLVLIAFALAIIDRRNTRFEQ